MNWDQIAGQLKQMQGSIQARWENLTDEDVDHIEGSRERLEGKIQERYGVTKEEAKSQVDEWTAA